MIPLSQSETERSALISLDISFEIERRDSFCVEIVLDAKIFREGSIRFDACLLDFSGLELDAAKRLDEIESVQELFRSNLRLCVLDGRKFRSADLRLVGGDESFL